MFKVTKAIFQDILSLDDFLQLTQKRRNKRRVPIYGKEQNIYSEDEMAIYEEISHKMAIFEEIADKTIEQIADNKEKTTYLDLTKEELYEDLLQGDHQVFVILKNSLLYDALGYVYGSYDGVEIAQKNGKLVQLNDGNLYFFDGYNTNIANNLFENLAEGTDLTGRQAFLKALNE